LILGLANRDEKQLTDPSLSSPEISSICSLILLVNCLKDFSHTKTMEDTGRGSQKDAKKRRDPKNLGTSQSPALAVIQALLLN